VQGPVVVGQGGKGGEEGGEGGEDEVEIVYIVVVGLNEGVAEAQALQMATLNELCESGACSWYSDMHI